MHELVTGRRLPVLPVLADGEQGLKGVGPEGAEGDTGYPEGRAPGQGSAVIHRGSVAHSPAGTKVQNGG